MPDPRLFAQGLVVAAVVSLLVTRALAVLRPGPAAETSTGQNAVWLGALAGLAAGWYRMGYSLPWPPATGLDRLLAVVLPLTLVIDLILRYRSSDRTGTGPADGRWGSLSTWFDPVLRGLFCLTTPVILLWKSVHLDWWVASTFPPRPSLLLLMSGVCLVVTDWSLLRFSLRGAATLAPLGLLGAVLSAGLCVLLAGYIKGGAVAFPLTGSLVGCLAAIWPWPGIRPLPADTQSKGQRAIVSAAISALYGVLFVGCAFGKLTGTRALLVGLAPLAGWVVEIPRVRSLPLVWRIILGLCAVSMLLGMALAGARLDFERSLGPLAR